MSIGGLKLIDGYEIELSLDIDNVLFYDSVI